VVVLRSVPSRHSALAPAWSDRVARRSLRLSARWSIAPALGPEHRAPQPLGRRRLDARERMGAPATRERPAAFRVIVSNAWAGPSRLRVEGERRPGPGPQSPRPRRRDLPAAMIVRLAVLRQVARCAAGRTPTRLPGRGCGDHHRGADGIARARRRMGRTSRRRGRRPPASPCSSAARRKRPRKFPRAGSRRGRRGARGLQVPKLRPPMSACGRPRSACGVMLGTYSGGPRG